MKTTNCLQDDSCSSFIVHRSSFGEDAMAERYSPLRQPLVDGDKSLAQVTDDVCAPLERRTSALWWTAFLISSTCMLLGVAAVSYQILTGIGTWGLNRTVGWAFDITNFVFWIG